MHLAAAVVCDHQFCAAIDDSLPQTQEPHRGALFKVAIDHQDRVAFTQLLEVCILTDPIRPGNVGVGRGNCGRHRHCAALEHIAEERPEQVRILIGDPVADDASDARSARFVRNQLQSSFPCGLHQFAARISHQRVGQSILRAGEMMDKAPLVARPDFVDLLVLARHHTLDFVTTGAGFQTSVQ